MPKTSVIFLATALVLVSLGFLLVGIIGYAMRPEWLSAQQIQEEAEQVLSKPVYPSAPGNQQVVQQTKRSVCIQVPEIGGVKWSEPIPRVTMKNVCSEVPDQTTISLGPTTADTKQWEDKVADTKSKYLQAVRQESTRISERQRGDLKIYVKDMLQISTGVIGLITSVAALVISTMKGEAPKPLAAKEASNSMSSPEQKDLTEVMRNPEARTSSAASRSATPPIQAPYAVQGTSPSETP
jgi:hypothetical protein